MLLLSCLGEAHLQQQPVDQESESVSRQKRSQGLWEKMVFVGLVPSPADRGVGLDVWATVANTRIPVSCHIVIEDLAPNGVYFVIRLLSVGFMVLHRACPVLTFRVTTKWENDAHNMSSKFKVCLLVCSNLLLSCTLLCILAVQGAACI